MNISLKKYYCIKIDETVYMKTKNFKNFAQGKIIQVLQSAQRPE